MSLYENYMLKGDKKMKNLNPIFIITIFLITFSLFCPQRTHAGEVYKYTDENGNTVISNDTIPERYKAKAKRIDSYREPSTPERKGLEKGAANWGIDKQIQEIDKQIAALTMPKSEERNEFVDGGSRGKGYIKKWKETVSSEEMAVRHAKKIKDLLTLKADIISKAQRLDAEMRNPQDAGLKMRNQQADIEDKMKRQQRDMEDKKDAMEVKMRSQKSEIEHLERDKRMSEHNQRMQQLRKDMGQ